MDWIDRYYGGQFECGSVPATEHSVMSAGIATVGELETFRRLLALYPTGVLAVVSDTFDLWKVLTEYLPALKSEIRERNGKLVIRPDSGDPELILCGDPSKTGPAGHGVINLLWDTFRGHTNAMGYKVLAPWIGAIYGDSITLDRAHSITANLERQGYASTNVTFGVGSFSYQFVTRDVFSSAMKATWAEVDGKGVNLFKDPVTDDGTKRSATGRLAVLQDDATGELRLLEAVTIGGPMETQYNMLEPVWKDGKFVRRQTFEEVRQTLRRQT